MAYRLFRVSISFKTRMSGMPTLAIMATHELEVYLTRVNLLVMVLVSNFDRILGWCILFSSRIILTFAVFINIIHPSKIIYLGFHPPKFFCFENLIDIILVFSSL